MKEATDNTTEAPAPQRRRFLNWLWGTSLFLILAELAWVTTTFLRPRRTPRDQRSGDLFTAGPVSHFAPGTVTAFPGGRFYLSRLADGGFLALKRECTHLGCTLPWSADERRFVCPCHASSFDSTGQVVQAPAPRPLDLFPVRIEHGIVKVDLSTTRQRTAYDSSQVVRA